MKIVEILRQGQNLNIRLHVRYFTALTIQLKVQSKQREGKMRGWEEGVVISTGIVNKECSLKLIFPITL